MLHEHECAYASYRPMSADTDRDKGREIHMRNWPESGNRPSGLRPVDIVDSAMRRAILNLVQDGPKHGIEVTGELEVSGGKLVVVPPDLLKQLAERQSLQTVFGPITGVSVVLGGHRAELRSDGVVLIETGSDVTPQRCLESARTVLECAFNARVNVSGASPLEKLFISR